MMKRLPVLAFLVAVGAAVLLSAAPRAVSMEWVMPEPQDTVAATMINRPGQPPHIAVPLFVVLTADQPTQDAARALTDVLTADLKFEREFDVMPAASYAGIPSAQSIEDLPYERWAQLGADYIALGTVKVGAGGKFDVELRVVSVKERRQAYGKGYEAPSARSLRKIAHTFSDEMHKDIRGVDGIARTKIAFSSTRDGERIGKTVEDRNTKEIYIMDYDGFGPQRVTANRALNLSPSWCPDGMCLAFMSYNPVFPDIVVQNIYQVGLPSRPAHGTDSVHNYLPRFSPDGTKIAYGSTRDGKAMDIYVVNRDGSGERRLTNNDANDGAPTWSPSGNQIAFTSNRSGSVRIYTMNPDGSGLKGVDNNCSHCDRPTYAPGIAGLLLAYSTQTGVGFDIELLDVSSGQARRLTSGEGTNESPSFAPNGRHVLFFTTRWGKEQLAIVDIDGKNVRRLTNDGKNTYPSWSGFLK